MIFKKLKLISYNENLLENLLHQAHSMYETEPLTDEIKKIILKYKGLTGMSLHANHLPTLKNLFL